MQVHCASCGALITAADLNLDRMIAKCSSCNAVFALRMTGDVDAPAPAPLDRVVPLPARIKVLADEPGSELSSYRSHDAKPPLLVVERSWFTPLLIFFAFFCLIWDGFLVVWYATAISTEASVALLFPLIHVSVGVVLTYRTICGFVNRTRIEVRDGLLTTRHGPLPWPGARSIATDDLLQLFCEEHRGNKGSRTYSLSALLKTGHHVKLLSSLPEPDQALYLEALLESRLGIVDRQVAGEMK